MQNLVDFLKSQKILVLATHTQDPTPHPWIANVYYVFDEEPVFYMFGEAGVKWTLDIQENPQVAFSVAWSNPENASDRKGIQAVGEAHKSEEEVHLDRAIDLYSQVFPLEGSAFKQKVVSGESGLFIVRPKYIKYWDDSAKEKINSYQF